MIATCASVRHLPCFCCTVEQFEEMKCFCYLLFSTPSIQLPIWLNSEKVCCEINHVITDPFYSHQSRIDITTVIYSISDIFLDIYVYIKKTTLQTVQLNCTNSMYFFRSKVIQEIQLWEPFVKEHLISFVIRKIIAYLCNNLSIFLSMTKFPINRLCRVFPTIKKKFMHKIRDASISRIFEFPLF